MLALALAAQIFICAFTARSSRLTRRMRVTGTAAVAYRTRNAGACVRLTAATNDKAKANRNRNCCSRCLCVLIPFDKIIPGIAFKWGFGPHPHTIKPYLFLARCLPACLFLLSIAAISNKCINKYYWVQEAGKQKSISSNEIKGRVRQYRNLCGRSALTNCCRLRTHTKAAIPLSLSAACSWGQARAQKAFSKHDKVLIPRLTPFVAVALPQLGAAAAGRWWQVAVGSRQVAGSRIKLPNELRVSVRAQQRN